MIRRFTSGPNPAARVARDHGLDVVAVDAQAVADAVVARQVGRRLGRGQQVVGRQAVARARGSSTRSTVAPAGRQRLGRLGAPGRPRPASTPSTSSGGQPHPQPLHAVVEARERRAARAGRGEVESQRVVAGDHVEERGGVGHGGREGADLVERAGEGDEAVARHGPVGGLHAHHAAQRGRLADRPAGVGAEGQRAQPGGHRRRRAARRAARGRGRGRRGCGWGRRPSSRWTSPWRTRRGWSCRRRRRRRPAAARPRWRRRAGASRRGSATSTWWGRPGCRGCPSAPRARRPAGPGPRPAATAASTAAASARAASCRTVTKACSSPSVSSMAARWRSTTVGGRRPAPARSTLGEPAARRGVVTVPPPGSAGTRKRPSSTAGAWARTSARSSDGRGLVGRSHVPQRQRVGGGLHPVGVEGGHLGGVVEDGGQLPGVEVELVVGQVDAGQPGHVGGVVAGEAARRHQPVVPATIPPPVADPLPSRERADVPTQQLRTKPTVRAVERRRRSRGWPRGSSARATPARPGPPPRPRARRPTRTAPRGRGGSRAAARGTRSGRGRRRRSSTPSKKLRAAAMGVPG